MHQKTQNYEKSHFFSRMFSTYHALLQDGGRPTFSPPNHGYLSSTSRVYAHVWKKTSPDFPAEYLSRWLSIWSGWWNLVCARLLFSDVEVTMRREFFWEEIIKLQTLKMRLLWWPRQSSCFRWQQLFATWPYNIMAPRKMTFPLLLYRDELHSLAFSLSTAALYDTPHHLFIHGGAGEGVCEYPGKLLSLPS